MTTHRTIALVITWLILAASAALAVADLIMGNPWAEMAAPGHLPAWLATVGVAIPWVLVAAVGQALYSLHLARRQTRQTPAPTRPPAVPRFPRRGPQVTCIHQVPTGVLLAELLRREPPETPDEMGEIDE